MKISCIIPVYNEEKTIEDLAQELTLVLGGKLEPDDCYEIVIVDDNSTDASSQIIDGLSQTHKNILGLRRSGPPNFARAIKQGIKASTGEIIIFLMADRSDDPVFIPEFIRRIKQGYDIIYGSRFIKGSQIKNYPQLKMLANRAYNSLAANLFSLKRKDITNAFKAYRREVIEAIGLRRLDSQDLDISVEIALKAHLLGFKSLEVPVSWQGRQFGKTNFKLSKTGAVYLKRLAKTFFWKQKRSE